MAGNTGELGLCFSSNVAQTLRIMRKKLDTVVANESRILKVPECHRQPTAEYTPELWRFGLHNRNDDLYSETAKRAVVVLLGLDECTEWTRFCDVVVPDPMAMLKCYGLHMEMNSSLRDDIKQVLALDALFLAARFEFHNPLRRGSSMKLIPHVIWNAPQSTYYRQTFVRWIDMVQLDLLKIENQIPFDVIKRAINQVEKLTYSRQASMEDHAVEPVTHSQLENIEDHIEAVVVDVEHVPYSRPENIEHHIEAVVVDVEHVLYSRPENIEDYVIEADVDVEYTERWMRYAVQSGLQEFMVVSNEFFGRAKLSESHHIILAAAHEVICGVKGKKRTEDKNPKEYIHVPSATKLMESGISIRGVAGPLSSMACDKKKKCFVMPKMQLFDGTVALVRNMARYEFYDDKNKCSIFHDYVFLMLDLIKTPLDLTRLVSCEVIYNGCGNKGFDVWRALDEHPNLRRSSKEHNLMKRDINKRCDLKRYKLWSEFKTLFLSRPWLTISVVAITLVTLATLIQTYATVISSDGMKPKFKP